MEFNWPGLIFWLCIIVSFSSFILAFSKRSWRMLLLCTSSLCPIVLYIGVGGELRFVLFLPFIPLWFLFLFSRKMNMKDLRDTYNLFTLFRDIHLVILPLTIIFLLFVLYLGSAIAEGPTNLSFTLYIWIIVGLLLIEFCLLLLKRLVKSVVLLSSLTVLFLFADLMSDTFIENLW